MDRVFVVVPAAGGSTRFGAAIAKQYADLAGAPLLARTLERLRSIDSEMTFVVVAADDREFERRVGARPRLEVLRCGGATRAETVRNALEALSARCANGDWVVIHDAARPCVPRAALARLVQALRDDPVGGLLAIPMADTLKRAAGDHDTPRVARTEDRFGLWQAQTPQMFRYAVLAAAMADDDALRCTDESQAVEALAAKGGCAMPRLVQGSAENIKVTYPEDLALAAAILQVQAGP
jgi:2-C-methyl-D-erythritol 4-phosphate cytidylyltransferase